MAKVQMKSPRVLKDLTVHPIERVPVSFRAQQFDLRLAFLTHLSALQRKCLSQALDPCQRTLSSAALIVQ